MPLRRFTIVLGKRAMQSIVQLPYNIYHALNKLQLRTRRSRAPIKKCALITKVRLLTRFYGMWHGMSGHLSHNTNDSATQYKLHCNKVVQRSDIVQIEYRCSNNTMMLFPSFLLVQPPLQRCSAWTLLPSPPPLLPHSAWSSTGCWSRA